MDLNVEQGASTRPLRQGISQPTPTHDELVDAASRWLRGRCYVVIAEMTSACGETADAIGWGTNGVSTLVECKTSRSDFLADAKKYFRRMPERGLGARRYYLAPKGLLQPGELPERWGLLEWDGGRVKEVLAASSFRDVLDANPEVWLLVSALRRVGQNAPERTSVKCYKYTTKCRGSIGVEEAG